MSHDERRRASRWWWLAEGTTALLVILAFVAVVTDAGTRLGLSPDPVQQPAQVAPPLSLPTMHAAAPVAQPLLTGNAVRSKIAAAVGPGLADPRLGPHKRLLVTDLTSGKTVFDYGSGSVTPASTNKVVTSTAALATIGPAKRFATRVVKGAGQRIVLIGGGDPFLASKPQPPGTYPAHADLTTLARQTAAALRGAGTGTVTLGYDDSLFGGSTWNPTWPATYRDVVPPITALWADEGHNPAGYGYVTDPSRTAAELFAAALTQQGIAVRGAPIHQVAPKGAKGLAVVRSAPLGQIVSRLLLVSDNNAAEVVGHQVGVAAGTGGTFAGGVQGVEKALRKLDVPLAGDSLYDGSGLSRDNRLAPATILGALRAAASDDHPELRQVITGLPVAGFSGSLEYRFDDGSPAARGRVTAKTGTLDGVHGLAGLATDASGDLLGFVLVADRVRPANNTYAEEQLDRIAGSLGACRCGAGP